MLMEIARYISIYMAIPICTIGIIWSIVKGVKTKNALLIVQIVLFGIQLFALIYRIVR